MYRAIILVVFASRILWIAWLMGVVHVREPK
jgi:hypothetical protein